MKPEGKRYRRFISLKKSKRVNRRKNLPFVISEAEQGILDYFKEVEKAARLNRKKKRGK